MDRNMITVMSGQIVDFYDHDFRELYANSDKLDLFKEFHLSKPQTGTLSRAAVAKRPPAATSRFQVNLGDATRGDLKIPAHKYHNPKYLLALGQIPGPAEPMQEFLKTMEPQNPEDLQEDLQEEPENLPVETEKKKHKTLTFKKKKKQDNNTSDAVIEDNTPKHTDENFEKTSVKKRRGWKCLFKRSK